MYCKENTVLLLSVIILSFTAGVLSNHMSRSRSQQGFAARQYLGDRLVQNSFVYESIILELLKRRLGLSRYYTKPRTISLPDNYISDQSKTTRQQSYSVTPSPTRTFPTEITNKRVPPSGNQFNRMVPPNGNQFNGTPLELMNQHSAKIQQSSAPTSNLLTSKPRNPTMVGNNIQRPNKRRSRQLNSVISLGRKGGFEFHTADGVRFKLPGHAGKLLIKSLPTGIEMNYVTPRPRKIQEEEEFEL